MLASIPRDMHVLIDDKREEDADVIIRNPSVALSVLTRLDGRVTKLSMDNDMGHGPEGKHVLYEALSTLARPPRIVTIVTANPVAAQHMRQTLERFGYTSHDRFTYVKS